MQQLMSFPQDSSFETSRCVIRRARPDDLAKLSVAIAAREFPLRLPLSSMLREGRLSSWLDAMCRSDANRASHLWSIDLKSGESCVGQVGVSSLPESQRWALFFWIAPQFWGKFLATEAVCAVLQFVSRQSECTQMWAATADWNAPGIALLVKLGFVEIARTPAGYVVDGEPQTTIEFLLRNPPGTACREQFESPG